MSASYLIAPLSAYISTFSEFESGLIEPEKFDLESVIEALTAYYPGIEFTTEPGGGLFAHYMSRADKVSEVWILPNAFTITISDDKDAIVEIAILLQMSAFDVEGTLDCISPKF